MREGTGGNRGRGRGSRVFVWITQSWRADEHEKKYKEEQHEDQEIKRTWPENGPEKQKQNRECEQQFHEAEQVLKQSHEADLLTEPIHVYAAVGRSGL
ncbi:hypothetical protein [Alicyclobacillus acidocaldarius]|uniref:hypothetical protein n=1 Tax=Alicyclobacillus acidocaldarius TaxID=405212 RepID=UPI001391CD7F|nr:hypothetical protein [Alicyclobacillus acidocaldarius]